MKRYLLLLMVIISINLYTQEFAPIGAIWHYSQGTINPQIKSFKTIESVSDTIINGVNCRKLVETDRYSTPLTQEHFMFQRNDSVFFYFDEEHRFYLLYDFGAVQGDTILLQYFSNILGYPLPMIIDSIGSININDQTRKIQYVNCGDGLVVEFGGKVISGIGNIWYLFPMWDNETHGPLRCYNDDSLGLFINDLSQHYHWDGQNCEQEIHLSVKKYSIESLTVYPNPTARIISIKDVSLPFCFKIYDMAGCIHMEGMQISDGRINIIDLSCGLYILEITSKNQTVFGKIIKH